MFKDQMQQDVIMVLKFPSNSPVTHVAANTLPHLTVPAVVTVTCSRLFAVNRWHNTVGMWPQCTSHTGNRGCLGHTTCYECIRSHRTHAIVKATVGFSTGWLPLQWSWENHFTPTPAYAVLPEG